MPVITRLIYSRIHMESDPLTLTGDTAQAIVDVSAGGRLASLVVHDVELLVDRDDDPVLWGCYPMVPFAGRVRGGEFEFAGKTYALAKNFGDHAMHGFGFTSAWAQTAENTIALDFSDPWPFAGRVEQHFSIDEGSFTMRMTATAHVPQPMMLGWHPWFRKSTALGEAVLDFHPSAMYERGDEPLPTGALVDPKPRPWDDCFTGVLSTPNISWGDLSLDLHSSADHWVVFDEPEHAMCIEPQTGPPNAFNLSPTVLDEGEQLTLTFTIAWS